MEKIALHIAYYVYIMACTVRMHGASLLTNIFLVPHLSSLYVLKRVMDPVVPKGTCLEEKVGDK